MKRWHARFLLGAFASATLALTACAPTTTGDRLGSAARPSGPALWKVSDEDTTIYLLGTIHALPEGVPWYEGRVANALGTSQALVTELPVNALSDPASQAYVSKVAILPPNKRLREFLTDDQRLRYEKALATLELKSDTFDSYKPWFAATTLSMLPLMKAGYSPEQGVEQVVAQKASPSIARDALETLAFQMDAFDKLPMDSQVAFLMATADGVDQIVPTHNALVQDWANGDAEKIAELMNSGLTDPILAESLLFARNRNWAEWIAKRLDTPGTVFVAVGAGHLAGQKSVQDYLSTRGIVAERVK